MKQEFKEIEISDLKLDLENPRLPKSKQGIDENTVIEFMLLNSATLELMKAIGENDFFAGEQLLVVPDKSEKDKYIVVEGNRRLTSVKLLSNPELSKVKTIAIKQICDEAEYKPTKIPCLVFYEKQEILKYLGFRHITGIKSWRLLEKARYLLDLKNAEFNNLSFTDACRNIAKSIGSTSSYIKRLLTGVKIYKIIEDEGFYQIDGLNDTKFHLNYITDSLNKENIREFLKIDINSEEPIKNIDLDNLKKIITWWFKKTEGKSRLLGDSKQLKMLDKVLTYKTAFKAFEDGTPIHIAIELTNDMDVLFQKEVEKSLMALEQADQYSNKVTKFYSKLYDDLKNIRDITSKIKSFQQQKENGDDF